MTSARSGGDDKPVRYADPLRIPLVASYAGNVGLYLAIGIALVAIGFLLPGPCPNRNTDVVNNIIFVLTWPVGLYSEVFQGHLSAQDWLRAQACEGGGKLGPKTIPG